jgi:hypothetical protein
MALNASVSITIQWRFTQWRKALPRMIRRTQGILTEDVDDGKGGANLVVASTYPRDIQFATTTTSGILQHNAHFRDNSCRFGPPLLHRVDHVTVSRFFLACAVNCSPPSLSPLLQAQNIASPKWLPTAYAPGLSKTAACVAYCMDCFNYKYGPPS